MPIKKKTKDEILKANLNRTLNKLKLKVAEREEIWLDLFELVIPLCIEEGTTIEDKHVVTCSLLVDRILEEYESRWGA